MANDNPIPYADDVRPEDTVNALQTVTPSVHEALRVIEDEGRLRQVPGVH